MASPPENRGFPLHRWTIRESNPDQAVREGRRLAGELGCSQLLARVLLARGFSSADAARRFLNPSEADILPPKMIPGLEKARDRLLRAIRDREPVLVHGDYDVDGVVGAVILHRTLKELGCASRIFLPSREVHGYGFAMQAVEKAREAGIGLIVTVDCGISSARTVAEAVKGGIEVIVTDHHALPDALPSDAILVHPELDGAYPGGRIAGATVAYKLVLSIVEALGSDAVEVRERFLPAIALATVADVCPLTDENRVIVARGMAGIPSSSIPGLKVLYLGTRRDVADMSISARDLAFGMAPCLNAAGRMGDALPAAKLLLASDMDSAWKHFRSLQALNRERRRIQEETCRRLSLRPEAKWALDQRGVLALADKNCLPGVAGLAASRLAEQTGRPTCVLAPANDEEGPVYRGSMRASGGEDLLELMQPAAEFIERFGGHPGALGLTVRPERLDGFMDACRKIQWQAQPPELVLDFALEKPPGDPREIAELDATRPWGAGNPQPAFVWGPVTIEHTRAVGREGEHIQVGLQGRDGSRMKGIGFSLAGRLSESDAVGRSGRAAGHFIVNDWQGTEAVEFQLTDFELL